MDCTTAHMDCTSWTVFLVFCHSYLGYCGTIAFCLLCTAS